MITGYTRPLYLLPFDHRASYISGLFGWNEPLNVEQTVTVANSKHVIYAGFQQAIADHVPQDHVGLLVDEEFGSAILRDAVSKDYITAMSRTLRSILRPFIPPSPKCSCAIILKEMRLSTSARPVASDAYRTICTRHKGCSCLNCSSHLSRCNWNRLRGTRTPMTCSYAHA